MIDQQQFAPPRTEHGPEQSSGVTTAPPTRQQVSVIACDVAMQLGAPQAEALSCLQARLVDAKGWLTVTGADDARVWLVIVRAAVGMPRLGGGVYKAQRLEIAIDGTNGRALGFRLAN